MTSDEQIIKGCIKGKRHAYNMLYKKHASTMLVICMRYSHTRSEAEDVLQEGFIRVFSKIDSFEGRGSFEGWLKRIMVNTAINYYKANKKHQKHEQFDIDDISRPPLMSDSDYFDTDQEIKQEELMQMINELPDGYRMVFNLYIFEGMSHQEISEIMEFTVSTSKSQLSKARKLLRLRIDELMKKKVSV